MYDLLFTTNKIIRKKICKQSTTSTDDTLKQNENGLKKYNFLKLSPKYTGPLIIALYTSKICNDRSLQ